MIIATVDSGIDDRHPAFRGRLLPGYNVLNPDAPPRDDNGHGTHVAGIIGAINDPKNGMSGAALPQTNGWEPMYY